MKKISIVGVGRLGLSFALLAESVGYEVVGIDKRVDYIDKLRDKTFKTSEPQVEQMLQESKSYFTDNIDQAIFHSDLLFIFVPTPSKENGEYDHQYIEQVAQDLVSYHLDGGEIKGKTLIICCTVMPGYCEDLQERFNKYEYGVKVVYNPEFIAQGNIIEGLKTADFVLMGYSKDDGISVDLLNVYRSIMVSHPVPIFRLMSHTAAELTKISINCYLTLKVAFANMCGEIAINSGEEDNVKGILEAIGSDKRIGNKFLNYGFPAAGICLPRDLRALEVHMENIGLQNNFISGIVEENDRHMNFLKEYYTNKNPDKNIPFIFNQLGYKKNVDILTESQHYQLCKELLNEGYRVNINESEAVINQVKKELEIYGDRVTYGTGNGTVSKFPERLIEAQKKIGFVIDL